ncbi:hypothetical protein ACFLU6_03550 [Acidobacteriota bacterium]
MQKRLFLMACLALSMSLLPLLALASDDQEVVVEPSYFTQVSQNEAGDMVAKYTALPVNYINADGKFVAIDRAVSETETGYTNTTNTITSTFGTTYGQGWEVSMGGHNMRFEPVSLGLTGDDGYAEHATPDMAAEAVLSEDGTSLGFAETFPGVSEQLIVEQGGLEHFIVLNSEESLPSGDGDLGLVYWVTLSEGLSVHLNPMEIEETEDTGIISMPFLELRDAENRTIGIIQTPNLWDNSEPAILAMGDIGWEQISDTEGYLTLKVSNEILSSMTFPVTIDPPIRQTIFDGDMANYYGSSWGHFELPPSTYAVRFNGWWYQIGSVLANFGGTIGVQLVQDCISTPVFNISTIPNHITDVYIEYQLYIDNYGDQERVVINDHKSDCVNDIFGFQCFANNIADGKNSESFLDRTPDFTRGKTYVRAFPTGNEDEKNKNKGLLTRETMFHLTSTRLNDIHDSARGEIETNSEYPLPAGYFAVAFHDTTELRFTLGIRLLSASLVVVYPDPYHQN